MKAYRLRFYPSITRQKCRVWIETSMMLSSACNLAASPGRNVGCGLKQTGTPVNTLTASGITRQKCRVWIETCRCLEMSGVLVLHHPAEMSGVD